MPSEEVMLSSPYSFLFSAAYFFPVSYSFLLDFFIVISLTLVSFSPFVLVPHVQCVAGMPLLCNGTVVATLVRSLVNIANNAVMFSEKIRSNS